MKYKILLLSIFLFPVFSSGQKPFTPLGAQWGGRLGCSPTFWPCPDGYPIDYNFEVTEDTIIQGKYCTLINDDDWEMSNSKAIVHQDGYQVYRYSRDEEVFKLVFDFSKDVGESWQIEVPPYWMYVDTVNIIVTEKEGESRKVSVTTPDGWHIFEDMLIYEGFGGVAENRRLLLADELFIISDPIYWDELTCYMDPVEGLLYGNAANCASPSTSTKVQSEVKFQVYPNPASSHLVLSYSLNRTAKWNLHTITGQTIRQLTLNSNADRQSMFLEAIEKGIYFWTVTSEGAILASGKIVLDR
jgi:hypothetical protein